MRLAILFSFFTALLFFCPIAHAQTADGSLIKGSGDAVYYLSGGKRYVFPNSRIYFSWFSGFSTVQQISDAELQTYPLGRNIYYRPGTRLVKITSDPNVYAVGFDGMLYKIKDEQAAISLYGADWAKRVDDMPDAFFSGYTIRPIVLDGTKHAPGEAIRNTETTQMYLLLEENGQIVARIVGRSQEKVLNIPATYIATVTGFNYSIAQTTQDLTTFFSLVTQVSTDTGTTPPPPTTSPTSPEQLPADATITLFRDNTIGLRNIVKSAPSTIVFQFSFKGDANHDVTVTQIPLIFYIDANGNDSDFERGSDIDGTVSWSIDQLIHDIEVRNTATGELIASSQATNGYTGLHLSTHLLVPAGQTVTLSVSVSPLSIPSPTPRFSVDVPKSDVVVSSLTASTVAINGDDLINGGTSPHSLATFIDYGSLSIKNGAEDSDGIRYFDSEATPLTVQFTALDEPVDVRTFSIHLTDRTDDPLSVEDMHVSFTQDGTTFTHPYDQIINGTTFQFTDLGLVVPANKSVNVAVTIKLTSYQHTLDNKRVQIEFVRDNFFATAEYSRYYFSQNSFGSNLTDKTDVGPLYRIRNGQPSFVRGPNSPSGSTSRYASTTVLTFSVTAIHSPIDLYKLSFRLDTNNTGTDGTPNDMLENLAQISPTTAAKLYVVDPSVAEGRVLRPVQQVSYGVYRPSVGLISNVAGFSTKVGDYGLFTYNFGSNPFLLSQGQTSTLQLVLDTTTIPIDKAATMKITLLGSSDFSWDDNSKTLADGTYLTGLPVAGGQLSFDRLTLP